MRLTWTGLPDEGVERGAGQNPLDLPPPGDHRLPRRADMIRGHEAHERRRGHLRRLGHKPAEIFALGIIEVIKGETAPSAYGKTYGVKTPPFDAVWFTPRREREDPCAKFKKQFKKK